MHSLVHQPAVNGTFKSIYKLLLNIFIYGKVIISNKINQFLCSTVVAQQPGQLPMQPPQQPTPQPPSIPQQQHVQPVANRTYTFSLLH